MSNNQCGGCQQGVTVATVHSHGMAVAGVGLVAYLLGNAHNAALLAALGHKLQLHNGTS